MKRTYPLLLTILLFGIAQMNAYQGYAQNLIVLEDGDSIEVTGYTKSSGQIVANGNTYSKQDVLFIYNSVKKQFSVMRYEKGKILPFKKSVVFDPGKPYDLGRIYGIKYSKTAAPQNVSQAFKGLMGDDQFMKGFADGQAFAKKNDTMGTVGAVVAGCGLALATAVFINTLKAAGAL